MKENLFYYEIENLRELMRSQYSMLNWIDRTSYNPNNYIGTFIRLGEKINPEEEDSDKIVGFVIGDGFSKIYYMDSIDGDNESIETVEVVNIESDKEVEFYIENEWDEEDIKRLKKNDNEKIQEYIRDLTIKEGGLKYSLFFLTV